MRGILGILFGFFTLGSALVGADKPQRLLQLQKITVGPFDNFQAAVADDESVLYYTRSQNLSSQIIRFDLKSGLSETVTGADTDAKAPALSPDGKTLAFTYFRRDAKGDVCILQGKDLECLTGAKSAEHSPFWVDSDTLAYVQSNDAGNISKLVFHKIKSKESTVILEGTIYSPSLAKDGSTLVYKSRGNDLVLYDLKKREAIRTFSVQLPGATGPARFSADGKLLYFAQYMVDSNRDLILDGRDEAAIFRIAVDTQVAVPEQLTSLQQNCSYPFPTAKVLYMTCAFEGALDVYRSALTGIVPPEWTKEDLWEAHRSSRSYFDRILLLNHLQTHAQAISPDEQAERTFSNFVLAGKWLPAMYYAEILAPKQKNYAIHKILLDTYARWEVLPKKENLGAFAFHLEKQRAEVQRMPASALQQLTLLYFDFFANDHKGALQKADKIETNDGLTLFWLTQLIRLSSQSNPEIYTAALQKRLLNRDLSEETRLYYLSRWLEQLKTNVDPSARVQPLKSLLGQDPVLNDLLDHEVQLYRLVKAENTEASITELRAIVGRVKRLQGDYYAMRLLFNRCMIVLYQEKKSRELATIMSLWLTYTNKDTKEYPFAIEVLRQNSLDLAYRLYHSKTQGKNLAQGAFFDSIRTSDDLESHYQYALLHFKDSPWPELITNYDSMQKDGLIRAESRVFVDTLRKVLSSPDQVKLGDLEDAAKLIDAMSDDHIGVGARYLFLGYLYHRQLIMTGKDFSFDRDLADKTHRAYLFAIDAAWNNDRIKAAALQNLGLLHSQLRNFSLAAEFFQKRHELNYPSVEAQQAVLWLEAKAMYRSYRFADALKAMEEALATKPANALPFQEKAAFYAWNAQNYELSSRYYQALLPALGEKAGAGLFLSQGFVLAKLKRWNEAEQSLLKAASLAGKDKARPAEGLQLIYQPEKVRFIALGLLARLELTITKKIDYAQQRLALFPDVIEKAKLFHFQPETLSAQRIKETQDLARWRLEAGQKAEGVAALEESLRLTQEHGAAFGYLAHTIFVSFKNLMLTVREQNLEWSSKAGALLNSSLEAADKELLKEKNPAAEVRIKWAEVQLIALAYKLRQDPNLAKGFTDGSQSILAADGIKILEKEKPALYAGLASYRESLARSLR